MEKERIDNLVDIGWKDDIIVFENSNINEIIEKLENWYGVEIELINEQKINSSFNGVYEKEILVNVLKSMAHAMDFNFEIKGNKVNIFGI